MVADFPQPPALDDAGAAQECGGHPRGVGYTMVGHDLMDTLMARMKSSLAVLVALRIERLTVGYHRESVIITDAQLAREVCASVRGVKYALAQLKAAGVLAIDVEDKGRASKSTIRLRPSSEWALDNGAIVAPFHQDQHISATIAPLVAGNGAAIAPLAPNNGATIAPLINKEKRKKREKDIPVGEAQTPRASPPSRKRKLTDAQLDAHNRKEQYKRLLIEGLRTQLRVKTLPGGEGKEMAAAEWFYGEGAERDAVLALYAAMKAGWWGGKYLPLVKVQGPWTEHKGDVAAYLDAEKRGSSHGSGQSGIGASQRGAGGATGAGTAESQRLKAKYAGVAAASDKRLLGNGSPPG